MLTPLTTTVTVKAFINRLVIVTALTLLLCLPAVSQTNDCPDVPGG